MGKAPGLCFHSVPLGLGEIQSASSENSLVVHSEVLSLTALALPKKKKAYQISREPNTKNRYRFQPISATFPSYLGQAILLLGFKHLHVVLALSFTPVHLSRVFVTLSLL